MTSRMLCTLVLFGGLLASFQEAQCKPTRTLMIADFEGAEALTHISSSGVSVSLTDKDVVSGRQAIEVRVRPFSIHKNQWPRVLLGTDFISQRAPRPWVR